MARIADGWKVALAGTGVNFFMSIPYAWSIIASGLNQQLGWSPVQAAFPYTVFLISYSLFMAPVGRWQDRVGPRRVVTIGGFVLGGSSLLSALFLSPAGLAILWGGVYGFGAACCYASATPAAMKWFTPGRKGLVAGVVVTGSGISAFLMAPLVYYLAGFGMRITFLVLGILLLAGITSLSRFINNPPDYFAQSKYLTLSGPWYRMFRVPQIIMLWLMFWVTTGIGVTFVTHLDTMARVQASFGLGYVLVALFAFFNAVGRITAGLVTDRIGPKRAMSLDFSITLLALVLLLQVSSPFSLGFIVSILGLAYGGLYALFPAAIAAYFGEKDLGLIYGLIFTALGAGGLFPLITGYLFDRQGDFFGAYIVLVIACVAVLLLSFFLNKPIEEKAILN